MLIVTVCLGTIMVNTAADCVLLSAPSFQETDVCYSRLLLKQFFQMLHSDLRCYFSFICSKEIKQMGSLSCNSQICFCAWAANAQLLFPCSLRLEYSPFRLMKQMQLCTTIGICCPDAWKENTSQDAVPKQQIQHIIANRKKERWQYIGYTTT